MDIKTMWVGRKCGIATPNCEPDADTYKLGEIEDCIVCTDPGCVCEVVDPNDYVIADLGDDIGSGVKVRRRA